MNLGVGYRWFDRIPFLTKVRTQEDEWERNPEPIKMRYSTRETHEQTRGGLG